MCIRRSLALDAVPTSTPPRLRTRLLAGAIPALNGLARITLGDRISLDSNPPDVLRQGEQIEIATARLNRLGSATERTALRAMPLSCLRLSCPETPHCGEARSLVRLLWHWSSETLVLPQNFGPVTNGHSTGRPQTLWAAKIPRGGLPCPAIGLGLASPGYSAVSTEAGRVEHRLIGASHTTRSAGRKAGNSLIGTVHVPHQ